MPSPIAHTTAGYVVYKISCQVLPEKYLERRIGRVPILLMIYSGFSMLPDIDAIFGILFGDLGRFHNNGTHSLIVGLGVALVGGLVASRILRLIFPIWFSLFLMSYEGHIILDYFTFGRGVMLSWPISTERFASPINLFYGLHWSEGVFSIEHIWTIASEALFAIIVTIMIRILEKRSIKENKPLLIE